MSNGSQKIVHVKSAKTRESDRNQRSRKNHLHSRRNERARREENSTSSSQKLNESWRYGYPIGSQKSRLPDCPFVKLGCPSGKLERAVEIPPDVLGRKQYTCTWCACTFLAANPNKMKIDQSDKETWIRKHPDLVRKKREKSWKHRLKKWVG